MAKRAKRTPKTLVIDASIAKRAGSENAVFPGSILCHHFLVSVRELTFQVAMSPDIYMEWKNHASRFSFKWLTEMYGRKRVASIGDVEKKILRNSIVHTSSHENHQKAMAKDCLLLEAALVTDNIVFSLDEKVRRLFRHAAVTIDEIKPIHWANPELSEDKVMAWLQAGAPADKKLQLGKQA